MLSYTKADLLPGKLSLAREFALALSGGPTQDESVGWIIRRSFELAEEFQNRALLEQGSVRAKEDKP